MSEHTPDADRMDTKATMGWVLGWLWMAFAAFNVVDILRHPFDRDSAIAGSVLLVVSGLVYVIALRPRLRADADRVLIRQPLRDIEIPWGAVTEVDARDTVRVHTNVRRYHSWVGHVSNRRRSRHTASTIRQQASDLSYVPGRGARGGRDRRAASGGGEGTVDPTRTNADYLAQRLEGMSSRFSRVSRERGHTEETRRWSWVAVGALAAPTLLLVLSVLLP
ncbi:MAG: PH domain-containing protein [Streptosporangiales bacterium]